MCTDKTIKEMLPAYLNGELDRSGHDRVGNHLTACEDCRTDLALLRIMREDPVPDPGEAYWAALPDRVYRAVRAEQARKRPFDLSWLTERLFLPRWAVAGTLAAVLLVSWLTIHRGPGAVPSASQGSEVSSGALVAETMPMSDLDGDQLDVVSSWAGNELVSIAHEAAPVMASASDTDIYEEITELNTKEAEQLSRMLDEWEQEES